MYLRQYRGIAVVDYVGMCSAVEAFGALGLDAGAYLIWAESAAPLHAHNAQRFGGCHLPYSIHAMAEAALHGYRRFDKLQRVTRGRLSRDPNHKISCDGTVNNGIETGECLGIVEYYRGYKLPVDDTAGDSLRMYLLAQAAVYAAVAVHYRACPAVAVIHRIAEDAEYLRYYRFAGTYATCYRC